MNRRERAIRKDKDFARYKDLAYLKAFRDGFDPRFCSSKVKVYTKEEIEEYERNHMVNVR